MPSAHQDGPQRLHALYVGYNYQADAYSPEELLERYQTVTGWAAAVAECGVTVTVVLRHQKSAVLSQAGVRYEFVPDLFGPKLRGWQIPARLHAAVANASERAIQGGECPVVHCNGLHYSLQLQALRQSLPAASAVVVQHHAEKPPAGLRLRAARRCLRAADGFAFAAAPMAEEWRQRRLISGEQPVFEIMEGSTHFRRGDRSQARARTGMQGKPVVLWVKRLNAPADPLTVLNGFERVLREVPGARLYMVYGECDLLPQVRARLADSPALQRSVMLLGAKPHAELRDIYNSADYFVLGSHYEGSGYSLAEAMACGVAPVVTAIPPFLMMTDGGRIGACWRVGDAGDMAAAFLRAMRKPLSPESDAAAAFFERKLSFPAIAQQCIDAYGQCWRRRMAA